ncbi:MAG: sugar phosphate isomerase/epimerase [Spirochaetota bacterium]
MTLLFFCPRWGSENLGIGDFCAKAKAAGYDGVELALPFGDHGGTEAILAAIHDNSLELIGQHWATSQSDIEAHAEEFRRQLEWLADAKPLFINSQTGKDWFPAEWSERLIAIARDVSQRRGLRIVHETHRGKFAYSAAVTRGFLERDPELRLSVDLSHWCVVSESLLADQEESLSLAISRAEHIHARVGFEEGPQVADPRAPEAARALEAHLGWWDRVVDLHRAQGRDVLTVTPEFGPAPYMPLLPWTGQPVSDQWGINVYMMELLRKRWS